MPKILKSFKITVSGRILTINLVSGEKKIHENISQAVKPTKKMVEVATKIVDQAFYKVVNKEKKREKRATPYDIDSLLNAVTRIVPSANKLLQIKKDGFTLLDVIGACVMRTCIVFKLGQFNIKPYVGVHVHEAFGTIVDGYVANHAGKDISQKDLKKWYSLIRLKGVPQKVTLSKMYEKFNFNTLGIEEKTWLVDVDPLKFSAQIYRRAPTDSTPTKVNPLNKEMKIGTGFVHINVSSMQNNIDKLVRTMIHEYTHYSSLTADAYYFTKFKGSLILCPVVSSVKPISAYSSIHKLTQKQAASLATNADFIAAVILELSNLKTKQVQALLINWENKTRLNILRNVDEITSPTNPIRYND